MNGNDRSRLGDYEVHRAWEGFSSIRQVSSGEIMHSRTDPSREARELYVEQSYLAERLREENGPPLVLWDVGLGAAANAMAAIECHSIVRALRPLRILSFENDLDSLRLALANAEAFPYLQTEPANAILREKEWHSPSHAVWWQLLEGDFFERMKRAPAPDFIFYDMFSTKSSAELWTADTFRRLFDACRHRAAELFTYSCSTANRAAMLGAGFFVARGRNAGEKIETTIALTPMALERPGRRDRDLLGLDWLEKWSRSAAKFPGDVAAGERSAFEKIIRGHQQFRNSAAAERLPFTT